MNELTTNAQTEIAIPEAALELVETSVSPNTCRAYSSIWHRFVATGLEGQISGRSPRVGTVQSLAARGTPVIEMQQTGRWQSPSMPGHYARAELAGRGAVARLLYWE